MQGMTGFVVGVVGVAGASFHHWIILSAVVLVGWVLRNRYHNGLNRYPGPFLASLTDWWRFWDVCGRKSHVTHIKLHERYGDVVRLGPNALSFSRPSALKKIYGLNKGFVKLTPALSDFYAVQQSVADGRRLPSLFSSTDNAFHARFRRCVNSAFAMSSLVHYGAFVDDTTRLFLDQTDRLYACQARPCDFTRWLQFYAFDVIGKITYSKRHGFMEKNEDIDGIVAYLESLFLYVAPIGQIPVLDYLFLKNPIYLMLGRWGLVDTTSPVAKFARQRMSERVSEHEKSPAKPDLLSKFLAARTDRPDIMTDTMVETMAVSMAFAGSETTAISLSAVFYYLLRQPRCLDALMAEIDAAARRGAFSDCHTGLVHWHEAQNLPYLDACVKEAFRLHPAAGLLLERITPPGGAVIDDHHVPGGTVVGCSAWVIHGDRAVFGHDADVYRPERWLVDPAAPSEAELARIGLMNGTMFQFGMGNRTCIGKNISLLEIYTLVPSLLRRFTIRFDDPRREWTLVNAWFVKQHDFYTRFEPRDLVQPDAVTAGWDGAKEQPLSGAA